MHDSPVPTRRSLIGLAAAIVAYENVVTVITGGELFTSGLAALTISAVLIVAMIFWSSRCRLTLAEIGISRNGALRGAAIGLGVGALMAIPVLLLSHSNSLTHGGVQYTPFARMTMTDVVIRALVFMPLVTALPEELTFRGTLLGLLSRRYDAARATVSSAMAFALWHSLIVFHTVGQTSLTSNGTSFFLGVVGGFAAVFGGGVLFAQLRIRSGNLTTSFCCHWTFNASVLVGLYSLQH